MFVRDTKELQDACKYACLGKSKTIPSLALDVKTIINNFTGPSYKELANLNRYDEEQDFSTLIPEDFDDISEIMPILSNGRQMIDAYSKAVERVKIEKQVKEQYEAIKAREKDQAAASQAAG